MNEQPAVPQTPPSTPPPVGSGKNTTMAFLAYIFFVIPLLSDAKNDPFVKLHTRQSLGLVLAWAIVWALGWFSPVPWSVISLLQLALFVLWIIGVVFALQGKEESLPVVGQFFEKIKI